MLSDFYGFFGNEEVQVMRTDIKERDGQYLIEIELPGFKKENIRAELVDGCLTIIAKRNEAIESDTMKTHYILKERMVGEVKRSFPIGQGIREEDITAGYKDGILSVIIVKKDSAIEEEKIKKIPIN